MSGLQSKGGGQHHALATQVNQVWQLVPSWVSSVQCPDLKTTFPEQFLSKNYWISWNILAQAPKGNLTFLGRGSVQSPFSWQTQLEPQVQTTHNWVEPPTLKSALSHKWTGILATIKKLTNSWPHKGFLGQKLDPHARTKKMDLWGPPAIIDGSFPIIWTILSSCQIWPPEKSLGLGGKFWDNATEFLGLDNKILGHFRKTFKSPLHRPLDTSKVFFQGFLTC